MDDNSNNKNHKVDDYLDKIIKEDKDGEILNSLKSFLIAVKSKGGFKKIMATIFIIALMLASIQIGRLLGENQDEIEIVPGKDKTINYITNKSSKSSSSKKSSKKSASKKTKTSSEDDIESEEDKEPDDEEIQPNEIGNTPSNIINGGFMAKQNDSLFYTNSNIGNLLTKKNTKTGEEKTIFNKEINSINVMGKDIYLHLCNSNLKMIEISIDGNMQKEVPIGCNQITAYKDYIISADDNGVYKIDKKDEAKTTIYKGNIKHATCYGGMIYFIEDGDLKILDNKTGKLSEIDTNVSSYSISNDGLYYIKDEMVFNENKECENIKASSINVSNGVIYFGNKNDGSKLYKKDLRTMEISKICDKAADFICVCYEYIAIKRNGIVNLI